MKTNRMPLVHAAIAMALGLALAVPQSLAASWLVKSHDPVSAPPSTLVEVSAGSFTTMAQIHLDGAGIDVDGLALDASQVLYGFEIQGVGLRSRLVRIETPGGAATVVGPMHEGRDIRGAAFTSTGRLLALDASSNELLEFDEHTGLLVGSPIPLTEGASAFDLSNVCDLVETGGGLIVLANGNRFLSLDATTGALTLMHTDQALGPDNIGVGVAGLLWGADAGGPGQLAAYDVQWDDDVFRYDVSAGFARQLMLSNILSGYNAGRGDMASAPVSPTAVGPGEAGPRGGLAARVGPNPTAGGADVSFTLPEPATVTITVHEVSGRLLRRLECRSFAAGAHSVRWRGEDDGGRTMAPGVYLVRVRTAGACSVVRVAVVR